MPADFSSGRGKRSLYGVLLLPAAVFFLHAPPCLAEAKTHTVVMQAMKFSPQVLEVNPGDTIVWVNKDPFPHNATATDRSFQSGDIAANASWQFKASKAGTFAYTCTLHPPMTASIVVKSGGKGSRHTPPGMK